MLLFSCNEMSCNPLKGKPVIEGHRFQVLSLGYSGKMVCLCCLCEILFGLLTDWREDGEHNVCLVAHSQWHSGQSSTLVCPGQIIVSSIFVMINWRSLALRTGTVTCHGFRRWGRVCDLFCCSVSALSTEMLLVSFLALCRKDSRLCTWLLRGDTATVWSCSWKWVLMSMPKRRLAPWGDSIPKPYFVDLCPHLWLPRSPIERGHVEPCIQE